MDAILLKYVVQNDLMKEVMKIYFDNAKYSNLITASCLDMFSIIEKNVHTFKVIKYIIKVYKN